ncbi:MAG: cytochrome c oxidase assembly protein [Nocardioides sp.]|uniref:cytochrome c oxidase assembly protein n=1 Tax=Nocardioides sp. TaxID=35761 RepID=UPI003D6C0E81
MSEPGIPDVEAATRWGLPLATGVRDLSAAMTIGALAVLCWCLPARTGQDDLAAPSAGAWSHLSGAVAWSAGLWAWSSLLTLVLTYAQLSGFPLSDPALWVSATRFATGFELGQYLALSSLLAAAVAVGAAVGRTTTACGILLVIAVLALWPLALTGHAAGSLNHGLAVESQALHLAGATVWLGGLVALLLVSRRLDRSAQSHALQRYSTLAGWSFLAVLLSGVVNATLRLNAWSDLVSSYGFMLGAKVVGLIALGVVGRLQRHRLSNKIASGRRSGFGALALGEIAIMAAAMGVGVALGKSAPPSAEGESALVGAEAILGYRMPGLLGWPEWITAWRIDGLWALLAVIALAWYWTRVRQVRANGDGWPARRALAWTTGWVLLLWATSGAPGVNGQVLFSMHTVQHMTIATAVPTFLVLGAPVTLLLRTSSARPDGSYGAREWTLRLLQSPYTQMASHPVVASAIFIISLVAFYYAGGLELSMRSHTAHVAMIAHFLIFGYLFASAVVGIDPGLIRLTRPFRVLIVMAVFGFHTFLSLSLTDSEIVAKDWFQLVHPPWADSLASDQDLGASLGWALGAYPLAIMAGVLIWQWIRAECADQRRLDRQTEMKTPT